MQSTFCVNCKQPLPAGAAFCGNCGARQAPVNNAPTQFAPPPAPPGDNAPTTLVPPPPPDATLRANGMPDHDPYASQYNVSMPPPPGSGPPPFSQYAGPGSGPGASGPYASPQAPYAAPPPPPGYAPGPPPVVQPGGVAPWAQPQKGSGRRFALGCIVAIVIVVLLLGTGGVLAFRALTSKSGNTTSQHAGSTPGTGTTPGANSTPTPTNTPGTSAGAQTLNNLNLQAIYAGVTITIMSAVQGSSVSGFQPNDPSLDALKIQVRLDNSADTRSVYVTSNTNVVGPNGNPYQIATTSPSDSLPLSISAQANILGYWYFAVPRGSSINDWKLVIGAAAELQETIPLNGVGYDPSVWQWVTKPLTTKNTVTYYGGALVGTITKVTTGVWTPGYQAPQGKRFILVDLVATNNSAASVNVGDPEFALLLPDGSRENQNTLYGYFIDDVLGGHESKDEGYICFLAPPAKGDFQIIFFNQDNGVAGQIDLGTL